MTKNATCKLQYTCKIQIDYTARFAIAHLSNISLIICNILNSAIWLPS
ncbi:hypothetical protein FDUTEX481_05689 [Tolypothrix sp. PCC 7601]|nr:hypothetical protein FDUTEX481_05689 [Tolypothrix sp. PCC 7601]